MLTYTQFTPLPNNPNPQAKTKPCPLVVWFVALLSAANLIKEINAVRPEIKGRKRECATGTEKPPVGCEPTGGLIKRNYSLISYTSLPSSGTGASSGMCT